MSEIENIGEVVDNLAAIIRDPHVIPETTDQVIRDHQVIIRRSSGDRGDHQFRERGQLQFCNTTIITRRISLQLQMRVS